MKKTGLFLRELSVRLEVIHLLLFCITKMSIRFLLIFALFFRIIINCGVRQIDNQEDYGEISLKVAPVGSERTVFINFLGFNSMAEVTSSGTLYDFRNVV